MCHRSQNHPPGTETKIATDLYSASLPSGAPLSPTGWKVNGNGAGEPAPVAGRHFSREWDGNGGRHCPCYVRGWDHDRREWRERIYSAGAAENLWGPYTIGFLEWDGQHWIDQPSPVFTATEDWEHGSVYEPNLIYHDGKWKMWYVAGSNHEDYLAQGYAESEDGIRWSQRRMFAPPEMRMFDFCVRQRGESFDAIFARVWVRAGRRRSRAGIVRRTLSNQRSRAVPICIHAWLPRHRSAARIVIRNYGLIW